MDSNLIPESDVQAAGRRFSRLGGAVAAMCLITLGGQILFGWLAKTYAPHLLETDWFNWVLTQAPMYLVAFPVFCIIALPMPKSTPGESSLNAGRWFTFLCISIAIAYTGSAIGNSVMETINTITGRKNVNIVSDTLLNSDFLASFIVAVLLAPVFEELIFRKIIIDRTRAYGEKTAILLSALIFALFHGNLYQYFYAFGIGLVFGYVYLKTGRVIYTILLHMTINLVNGIVPSWIMKNIDLGRLQEVLENLSDSATEEQLKELLAAISPMVPYLIALFVYGLLTMGAVAAGIALLVINRKKISLAEPEIRLPRERAVSTIFLNVGMIAMVAVCTAMFALNLFLG
ncbi:MAG: CPBP family intramembrane metalloprotease [Clostridiales bacterium]|nr:CPBP family intramembrane metalloprotease [Clostridiales bacterium]HOA85408.1 CPBP family intramembrane metalloprotease [Bacillota bacterium]